MKRPLKALSALLLASALLLGPGVSSAAEKDPEAGRKMRWLKIRVYENGSATPNVVVNVPVKVVEFFLRAAAASGATGAAVDAVNAEMAKDTGGRLRLKDLDLEAMWKELEKMDGQIVEVNDGGDRVSIYIE